MKRRGRISRDPFTWARRHGIRVVVTPGARRWATGCFLGSVFVLVNAELSHAEQRAALAEALQAHPVLSERVSGA